MEMTKAKTTKNELKEKKAAFQEIAATIDEFPADKFLKDNFLPYAWSFTLNRALSDVSGLKPVQRRILYTMYKRGLSPGSARQKVATLAGATLAIHPHGDASVAEALKNMGREHVFRVPLIDGKGDFGAPGAPGAAPRYIEARLNKAAWINLEEIADNATQMIPSYDDNDIEPSRIPVRWPVSLINGGSGIAVGYASNMPSHNPREIMRAAQLLLKDPDADYKEIHKIIKGPDFNMGGEITSNDGVKDYLETGRGTFRIRGRYNVEHLPRRKSRIEFYEIPYGTYPEKIIEEIQKGIEKKLFKEVASYKDLSDLNHPTRVVIETRQGVQYQKVLNDLFSNTSLETAFSANVTTVMDDKPVQSGIKDLLLDFIEFRKGTVRNKMAHAKSKKEARHHLVEGLLKVLIDIDAAIAIIRKSEDVKEASNKLQEKFSITKEQAEHVLSLQLRRLTRMDSLALEKESTQLEEEIKKIDKILTEEDVLVEHLHKEFDDTLKVITSPRRTKIFRGSQKEFAAAERKAIRELNQANKEQTCYITRFANGKILKTLKPFSYEVSSTYSNSPILESIKTNTLAEFVLVSKTGDANKLPIKYLPLDKPVTAKQAGSDFVASNLVGISLVGEGYGLAIATKTGKVKVTKPEYPSRESFTVINLDKGDEIVNANWIEKESDKASMVLTSNVGMISAFLTSQVRDTGYNAGGIIGMKLKKGEELIGFNIVPDHNSGVVLSQGVDTIKTTSLAEILIKGRGGVGVILQDFGKSKNELKQVYAGNDVIMTLTGGGGKTSVALPPITRRAARGSDFTLSVYMGTVK